MIGLSSANIKETLRKSEEENEIVKQPSAWRLGDFAPKIKKNPASPKISSASITSITNELPPKVSPTKETVSKASPTIPVSVMHRSTSEGYLGQHTLQINKKSLEKKSL